MTLLKVDLRVASTESFGDFKGFPVLNGIFKTLIDHTACKFSGVPIFFGTLAFVVSSVMFVA